MNQELMILLIPFLAAMIAWLLRKAKLEVNKKKIEEILHILYEIIFEIEKSGLSGENKKNLAIAVAENVLKDDQIRLLKKDKGSIGKAIQFVFERFAQPVIVGKQVVELIKLLFIDEEEQGS